MSTNLRPTSHSIAHHVDNVRLNPDASIGCRDNFDIGLGDDIREGFLDRVCLGQNHRLDHSVGVSDSRWQDLNVGDVQSLGHDIGLGHGVIDRGWDGLKSFEIRIIVYFISDAKAYLRVSDGEDLSLDRLVSDGHCRRGRTILVAKAQDQEPANMKWRRVDLLRVTLVDDDRGLVTTPTVIPLKTSPISTSLTIPSRSSLQAGEKDVPNSREYTSHRIPSCTHNHSPFANIHRQRKTNTASPDNSSMSGGEVGCTGMAERHRLASRSQQASSRTRSSPNCLGTEPGYRP